MERFSIFRGSRPRPAFGIRLALSLLFVLYISFTHTLALRHHGAKAVDAVEPFLSKDPPKQMLKFGAWKALPSFQQATSSPTTEETPLLGKPKRRPGRVRPALGRVGRAIKRGVLYIPRKIHAAYRLLKRKFRRGRRGPRRSSRRRSSRRDSKPGSSESREVSTETGGESPVSSARSAGMLGALAAAKASERREGGEPSDSGLPPSAEMEALFGAPEAAGRMSKAALEQPLEEPSSAFPPFPTDTGEEPSDLTEVPKDEILGAEPEAQPKPTSAAAAQPGEEEEKGPLEEERLRRQALQRPMELEEETTIPKAITGRQSKGRIKFSFSKPLAKVILSREMQEIQEMLPEFESLWRGLQDLNQVSVAKHLSNLLLKYKVEPDMEMAALEHLPVADMVNVEMAIVMMNLLDVSDKTASTLWFFDLDKLYDTLTEDQKNAVTEIVNSFETWFNNLENAEGVTDAVSLLGSLDVDPNGFLTRMESFAIIFKESVDKVTEARDAEVLMRRSTHTRALQLSNKLRELLNKGELTDEQMDLITPLRLIGGDSSCNLAGMQIMTKGLQLLKGLYESWEKRWFNWPKIRWFGKIVTSLFSLARVNSFMDSEMYEACEQHEKRIYDTRPRRWLWFYAVAKRQSRCDPERQWLPDPEE